MKKTLTGFLMGVLLCAPFFVSGQVTIECLINEKIGSPDCYDCTAATDSVIFNGFRISHAGVDTTLIERPWRLKTRSATDEWIFFDYRDQVKFGHIDSLDDFSSLEELHTWVMDCESFIVIYDGGDSTTRVHWQDTMYITYPEPGMGGGAGDSTYYWVRVVDGNLPGDTMIVGEVEDLISGTNISLSKGANTITINADSCLQDLVKLTDSTFQILDCAGNPLTTIQIGGTPCLQSLLAINDSTIILTLCNSSVGKDSIVFRFPMDSLVDTDTYLDSVGYVGDSLFAYRRDSAGVVYDSLYIPVGNVDTYIDTAFRAGPGLDSIRFYRDSAGVTIDSFDVYSPIDTPQTISLVVDSLFISDGNGLDLSKYLDNDTTYQSLSLSTDGPTDTIFLENGGFVVLTDNDSVGPEDYDWLIAANAATGVTNKGRVPNQATDIDSIKYTKNTVVINRDSAYCPGCELVIHHREIDGDALPTLRMYTQNDESFFEISASNRNPNGTMASFVGQGGMSYRRFSSGWTWAIMDNSTENAWILNADTLGISMGDYGKGRFTGATAFGGEVWDDHRYLLSVDSNGQIQEMTWDMLSDSISAGGMGSDNQTVDTFLFDGTTLTLALEDDAEAPYTVDLSGLGTDTHVANTDLIATGNRLTNFAGWDWDITNLTGFSVNSSAGPILLTGFPVTIHSFSDFTFTTNSGNYSMTSNTGDIDLSGLRVTMDDAALIRIPNAAAPTGGIALITDGDVFMDNSVTNYSHGFIDYYSGEHLRALAMPVAEYTTPINGQVPTYNSTSMNFEMTASSSFADSLGIADTEGNVVLHTGTKAPGGSDSLFFDKPNGWLGIGHNNPSTSLHIIGQSQDANTPSMFRMETNTGANEAGLKFGVLAGSGGAGYGYLQTIIPGVGYNRNLVINSLGGNVSIGNTNPGAKFHLTGSMRLTSLVADEPTHMMYVDAQRDVSIMTFDALRDSVQMQKRPHQLLRTDTDSLMTVTAPFDTLTIWDDSTRWLKFNNDFKSLAIGPGAQADYFYNTAVGANAFPSVLDTAAASTVTLDQTQIDTQANGFGGFSTYITHLGTLGYSIGDLIQIAVTLNSGTWPWVDTTAGLQLVEGTYTMIIDDADTLKPIHFGIDSVITVELQFQAETRYTYSTAIGAYAEIDKNRQLTLGDTLLQEIRMGDSIRWKVDTFYNDNELTIFDAEFGQMVPLTLDTLNSLLSIAAVTPDITFFDFKGSQLGLELSDNGDTSFVEIISGISSGDSSWVLNQIADSLATVEGDSLGQILTAGYIPYGDGTRGFAQKSELRYDGGVVLYSPRLLRVGYGDASGGDNVLQLGATRTVAGNAYIDLHNNATTRARMIKGSAANSNFSIQNWGEGSILFYGKQNNLVGRIYHADANLGLWQFTHYGDGDAYLDGSSIGGGTYPIFNSSGSIYELSAAELLDDLGGPFQTGSELDNQSLLMSHPSATTTRITIGNGGGSVDLIRGSGINWVQGSGSVQFQAVDASASNELQTFSHSDDGASVNYSALLSDGGGSVNIRGGTNVTVQRTGNTATINASSGAADDLGLNLSTANIPYGDGDATVLQDDDFQYNGNAALFLGNGSSFNNGMTLKGNGMEIEFNSQTNGQRADVINTTTNGSLYLSGSGSGAVIVDDAALYVGSTSSNRLFIGGTTSNSYIAMQEAWDGTPTNNDSYMQFAEGGNITLYARHMATNDILLEADDVITLRADGSTIQLDADEYVFTPPGTNLAVGGGPEAAHALTVRGTAWKNDMDDLWNIFSDRRLKREIEPISDAIEKIMALKPVSFRYNKDYLKENDLKDKVKNGYIAQDFVKVFPQDVTENEDGMLGLNASSVAPYTVAAVQELVKANENQQELILTQQQTIDDLRRVIVSHEDRLLKLEKIISKFDK